MIATLQTPAADELEALVGARHQDPFSLLGLHRAGKGWVLRVFLPYAASVSVRTPSGFEPMTRIHAKGVFAWQGTELGSLGRISMDMTVIDLSDSTDCGEGDWIDIAYNPAFAATATGLSQYEIFTLLGKRFARA